MEQKMDIPQDFDNQIIHWRRFFHQNPEVSLKEKTTTQKIDEILQSLNIRTYAIGPTGICGIVIGEKKSINGTVCLRADIDALCMEEQSCTPYRSVNKGVAHACGHDGHTASLLGAARLLQQNRASFGGTVKLLFQPAEEICEGAKILVEKGEFDDVDCALGIHFMPTLEYGKICCAAGPVMAGCDYFQITVQGKGGHISTPHLAANPLLAAAQILNSLQSIITQQFSPSEEILIGVGKFSGGTQYNIIPNEACMEGTIRYYDPNSQSAAQTAIRNMAENIARAYHTEAVVVFKEFTPPVINPENLAEFGQKIASEIVGEKNVIAKFEKSLAGDDFAFYQRKAPGLYVKIGSANPEKPETLHPLHHAAFDIEEKALSIAARYYTEFAIKYLN
jgi:amidohydrolase